MYDAKERRIQNLALFRECTPAEIRWISRTADELDVRAGRVLGYEGSSGREFVVMVDGVASAADGDGELLLGPGAYYGEAELINDRPRTATISTRTDVRLLVFGVRAFRALMDRVPTVAR